MERKEALKRMMAECARCEMCTGQVREKLMRMLGAGKVPGRASAAAEVAADAAAEVADGIISELVAGGFVSDERFAGSFVRDRYRFYGWGPRKVEMKLTEWGVDRDIISSAILGERELAVSTLEKILESKRGTIDRQTDAKLDSLRRELRRATESGDDSGKKLSRQLR